MSEPSEVTCGICLLPAAHYPGQIRKLPEGERWCHESCWDFFSFSRHDPLEDPHQYDDTDG